MNNFPAMTEERRQELVQFNRAIIAQHEAYAVSEAGWPDDVRLLVSSARITLAALTRDNAKLAREIVYRLVDVGEADPDVVDSYQVWVLRKLNGVKS